MRATDSMSSFGQILNRPLIIRLEVRAERNKIHNDPELPKKNR